MALSDADATVIVGILAAAAAVIGPRQWHVRRTARKQREADSRELIDAYKEQLTYSRLELAKKDAVIAAKDLTIAKLQRRGSVNDQP